MALKYEDIKVVSYVHVGKELVNTEDLTPGQKERLAVQLRINWLNGLFAGQAVFFERQEKKQTEKESEG